MWTRNLIVRHDYGHLLEIIFEDALNTTMELYKNCRLKVWDFKEKLKCTLCLKTN